MRIPDATKQFVLHMDACDTGVGAVLLQEHDELLCPVAYASRKLSKAERNYTFKERECLALVLGIIRFEKYLYGQKLIVELDLNLLVFLGQSKDVKGRLMRWAMLLQQHQMQLCYIKVRDNFTADWLS